MALSVGEHWALRGGHAKAEQSNESEMIDAEYILKNYHFFVHPQGTLKVAGKTFSRSKW
jgi:hypothetical protein